MSRWTSGSQTSLREANKASVLDAVKRFGGLTQVELVSETGLSAATISTIVKELVAAGTVEVRPTQRSGRRAQLVTMARRVGLAVGVHIGVRQLKIVLSDFTAVEVARQTLPLPLGHLPDFTLDRIALLVADLTEQIAADLDEVVGIGVAVPAPVDVTTGTVSIRGVLPGWEDEPIGEVLTRRLHRPALVDTDAHLGALAELTLGAGRGHQNVVYLRASHWTRAATIVNGRLHRGRGGVAGEIGHVQVEPNGAICRCGSRGCLDTVVGSDVLLGALQPSHGRLTVTDVLQRAAQGDLGCRRILADAGRSMGGVLAAACQMVSPDLVIVGGELAAAGAVLLDPMRAEIERTVLSTVHPPLHVVPAMLGTDAEVMGALSLVLQNSDVS